MNKITITDFSGGIQESYSPDDFSSRQTAKLKGIVPTNESTFESQWAAQSIGSITNVNAIFPLESMAGTFLVAIKTDGTLWWAKAPVNDATYTTANAITWAQLTTAENRGWKASEPLLAPTPYITIGTNPDYRFITGLPFEVYKYIKQPYNNEANEMDSDEIADGAAAPKSMVSGVLIHSRRFYGSGAPAFASGVTAVNQTAVVAFVDPTENGGVGAVKAVTFPNIRRWPQYLASGTAIAGNYNPIKPFVASTRKTQGVEVTFIPEYPYQSPEPDAWPKSYNAFHPYTYLDKDKALNPGRGFIPRANVGTMFGSVLILGDIEYRSDSVIVAGQDTKLLPNANNAVIGNSASQSLLRDGNTEPHRGSFYYSETDIDIFDPRSVLRSSGTDTRIAGMHVIDNRLINITTAGGENDGVIVWTGNLAALHPYSETITTNPLAMRKQVIKGGVGVADYPDTGQGHINQTCVWSEVGNAAFIDRLGGIFLTNGQTADRADRFGPKQPRSSTYRDHVAAVGKHLVAWRDSRLLLFSIVASGAGTASGCWTELVPPVAISDSSTIKSMVGSGQNLYMVAGGQVWRYALNGPVAERGCANNVQLAITISTASFGAPTEFNKVNWHRFGIGFYTTSGCSVESVTVNAGPALQSGVGTYPALASSRAFASEGYQTLVLNAGVGSAPIISATYVMKGQFVLESQAFWYTGATMQRGKP